MNAYCPIAPLPTALCDAFIRILLTAILTRYFDVERVVSPGLGSGNWNG